MSDTLLMAEAKISIRRRGGGVDKQSTNNPKVFQLGGSQSGMSTSKALFVACVSFALGYWACSHNNGLGRESGYNIYSGSGKTRTSGAYKASVVDAEGLANIAGEDDVGGGLGGDDELGLDGAWTPLDRTKDPFRHLFPHVPNDEAPVVAVHACGSRPPVAKLEYKR